MAALEAMGCGVPVVASRIGGLPELIQDGETGYLCEPEDVEGMASRLLALVTDRAIHDRIADAAMAIATSKYCSNSIVPLYEDYYREVLSA
jgi:glycosyltransferase involved in cell wall biosynthesis